MEHRGNIRDMDLYVSRVWPWDIFNECFYPTKIRVSDIDGIVERNGHVLIMEAKGLSQLHRPIPTGQQRLFDALVKIPQFTVVVLYGDPGEPQYIRVWGHDSIPQPTSIEEVRHRLRLWFLRVNGDK